MMNHPRQRNVAPKARAPTSHHYGGGPQKPSHPHGRQAITVAPEYERKNLATKYTSTSWLGPNKRPKPCSVRTSLPRCCARQLVGGFEDA